MLLDVSLGDPVCAKGLSEGLTNEARFLPLAFADAIAGAEGVEEVTGPEGAGLGVTCAELGADVDIIVECMGVVGIDGKGSGNLDPGYTFTTTSPPSAFAVALSFKAR